MTYKRYIYMFTGLFTLFLPYKLRKPVYVTLSLVFFFILVERLSLAFYSSHSIVAYINESIVLLKNIVFYYPFDFIQSYVSNNIISLVIYFAFLAIIIFLLKINSNQTKVSIVLIIMILILYGYN